MTYHVIEVSEGEFNAGGVPTVVVKLAALDRPGETITVIFNEGERIPSVGDLFEEIYTPQDVPGHTRRDFRKIEGKRH